MVTNLPMLAYFLNLMSIEHYVVQFWAKFWLLLRTLSAWAFYKLLDSLKMKANFSQIIPYFSLDIPLKSFAL